MDKNIERVREEYNRMYKADGFTAQRQYPNQELLRFMGRYFFVLPSEKRASHKILELGCGSGSNLWMIAKEGFSAYGIDISEEAICMGKQMMKKWNCQAELEVAVLDKIPYQDSYFDACVDVFSMYCLTTDVFRVCLSEIGRVIKDQGLFFSYFPSKNSDAFKNYKPSKKIDESTLDGIYRKDSPYYGNNYPFRFMDAREYMSLLQEHGFEVEHMETERRSYHQLKEYFEFIVVYARRYKKNPT